MKPATEILLSAAFVLTPEENWFGKGVNRQAGKICALLAIDDAAKVIDADAREAAFDAMDRAINKRVTDDRMSIIYFNDNHSHRQVLNRLYKAAELAEAE